MSFKAFLILYYSVSVSMVETIIKIWR